MDVAHSPNRAYAFACALVEELARAGLRHVCVCPGSRSTPLAIAVALHDGLRCWTQIDERAAGFFALGLARAADAPAAIVCTSGTAAANLYPAVAEASYAGVPLLVLSADRPPELREWGAGQTIDQHRLFGSHVRWFAETAPPEAEPALLRHARALACRALDAARERPAGPVHLNLPFREPLEPTRVADDFLADLPARDALAAEGRPGRPYAIVRHGCAAPSPDDVAWLGERLAACGRGVVACGPLDASPDLAAAIACLADRLGWPLLAEPTSQLRCGPHAQRAPLVPTADLLLRDEEFAAGHPPDFVLRFGATPTSKSFRLWLERRPPRELVLVDPARRWHDPSHLASALICCDELLLCDLLARRLPPRETGRSAWLRDFLDADARVEREIGRLLEGADLNEPRAVREIASAVPAGTQVYVSNSMPIRDVDAFWPAGDRPLRFLCNRGANGIDGLVASAAGAAAAGGRTLLLTGDLALLHDLSGLLAAIRLELPLVVVVLDNDGGGIFSHLPVAAYGEAVRFEEIFRTPHGSDLLGAARGLGVRATRVDSWAHFATALKDGFAATGPSVVVVPVDRDQDLARWRAITGRVGEALRETGA